MPDSLQKLQNEAGIKLVLANTEDPDFIGCFKQYRVAFYIAGGQDSLENFFALLDNYFTYKAKALARATPFEVHVYPYINVDLSSLRETMSYQPITHHAASNDGLPLKVFQAPSPSSTITILTSIASNSFIRQPRHILSMAGAC